MCNGNKQKKILTHDIHKSYVLNIFLMYPSVKTLAYSFYITIHQTTGKDLHIAFTERTILRTNKSLGVVPGKSHSSEIMAVKREFCSPAWPSRTFASDFTARVSILLEQMLPNFGGFHAPTLIKNQASRVAYFLTQHNQVNIISARLTFTEAP